MAVNKLNPTAANILSSLQIKGATTGTGPDKYGYVPILNAEGKLDIGVIPLDSISTDISIQGLNATAFVDLKSESDNPDGSIAKPFRTLQAAISATDSSGNPFEYFILAPGDYGSVELDFQGHSGTTVYFIGSAQFDTLTVRNYETGFLSVFINVSANKLMMATPEFASVTLLGYCQFGEVRGVLSSDDEVTADVYLQAVNIGPCATLLSQPVNAAKLTYVASAGRIGNDHTASLILGASVADALKRLQGKRLRLPIFKVDPFDHQISYDLEDLQSREDASAETDYYSFERFATTLVEALNAAFYSEGDDIDVGTVHAYEINSEGDIYTQGDIQGKTVLARKIHIGEGVSQSIMEIDGDGFLTIRPIVGNN